MGGGEKVVVALSEDHAMPLEVQGMHCVAPLRYTLTQSVALPPLVE